MTRLSTDQAETIALQAVTWIMAEEGIRDRFLALSGIDTGELATGLADHRFLAAVLEFLLANEPDLLAWCQDIDLDPELPLAAAAELGGRLPHWT